VGKISELLTRFGQNDNENTMKQIAEQPKIRYSKVYQYWACDYVTEQLKDIITPGNKYRLFEGEYPEEFYFFNDQGKRNDPFIAFYLGHFIEEDEDGFQEIVIPPEARKVFVKGLLIRVEDLLKMWEVIENDSPHEEDDPIEDLTKEDIEEMKREIREGKFRSWEEIKKE